MDGWIIFVIIKGYSTTSCCQDSLWNRDSLQNGGILTLHKSIGKEKNCINNIKPNCNY